jgi:hypothetical protein
MWVFITARLRSWLIFAIVVPIAMTAVHMLRERWKHARPYAACHGPHQIESIGMRQGPRSPGRLTQHLCLAADNHHCLTHPLCLGSFITVKLYKDCAWSAMDQLSSVFTSLSDPTRRRIIELLRPGDAASTN